MNFLKFYTASSVLGSALLWYTILSPTASVNNIIIGPSKTHCRNFVMEISVIGLTSLNEWHINMSGSPAY